MYIAPRNHVSNIRFRITRKYWRNVDSRLSIMNNWLYGHPNLPPSLKTYYLYLEMEEDPILPIGSMCYSSAMVSISTTLLWTDLLIFATSYPASTFSLPAATAAESSRRGWPEEDDSFSKERRRDWKEKTETDRLVLLAHWNMRRAFCVQYTVPVS